MARVFEYDEKGRKMSSYKDREDMEGEGFGRRKEEGSKE